MMCCLKNRVRQRQVKDRKSGTNVVYFDQPLGTVTQKAGQNWLKIIPICPASRTYRMSNFQKNMQVGSEFHWEYNVAHLTYISAHLRFKIFI